MPMKTDGIFQFGEFRVDALARTLRREEELLPLNRRAFDVLLYFVQNPGKVLTREELLKNVWAESFVDENSLAQSISVLRRALQEKPGENSYIATVPGRGYQFVSAVTAVASENGNTHPEMAAGDGGSSSGLFFEKHTVQTSVVTTNDKKEPLSSLISRNRPAAILAVVLVVAAASVAGAYSWKQFHRVGLSSVVISPTASSATARRSIAVLGFRNLSGRPEEGWLSTALAEMLTTELVAGEKLRLISGEDIARTKLELPLADADSLSRDTLTRLHNNLGSDFIVLGSYTALGEKSGTRIRLDVRLQDAVGGETIADVAAVGSEADLFDLATQVGSQLREKLGIEAVSPVEAVSVRASLPSNRDAARLYSEGLARLRVLDAQGARDLLQQATAADPKFSLAHSALAEAWFRMGYNRNAQQEARQAYDLSANLSRQERLAVEGRYRYIDREYAKAIEVYRALFTLFPDNVDYGLRLARMQVRGGKGHDALATVESLHKLSPPASEDPRIELVEAEAWSLLDPKRQEQPLARAVEKASSEGAREILAEARQMQCGLFRFLGQMQNAVAACREARDIFTAAGNPEGEARCLRTWADVIAQTDVPGSIRLYQQAQTIFRRDGSEAGVADVLNNLGNVYETLGDPATAEKMLREALPIYRLLDDKRGLTGTIGNIAGDRLDQGDLRGAIQLYEEARQGRDPADTGYDALSGANIAIVHQLQGDLAGARQGFEKSLATWQKLDDQGDSAYAMWSLGGLLLQQADLSGARRMYERALTIRTSAGDEVTIAETRLALADLSLEEAHAPVEQEAAMRQAVVIFQQQKARDDETQAWCILARALLAEGKTAAAKEAMQHARVLAAKSQNPAIRWQTAIVAVRIETAETEGARSATGIAASKELAAIIAKSRELGYRGIELDARLALAEIEMKTERTAAGRALLTTIEADAKAKGYNLIARKAEDFSIGKPGASRDHKKR
jgi:DNA-binding winged helix-turn-helix (wHTH) protein/tetratricopeptide (TPR) repeat protein